MKKVSCAIIQDLLPLYVDDVVSNETREMVDEHLRHCEACNKEVSFMKKELYLPVEKEIPLIQNLKKKWRNKRLIVSGLSIVLTAFILFAGNYLIFHHDSFIPYSGELVQIEVQDNGHLASHYTGEGYYSSNQTEPMTVNINGNEKRAIFFYYTKTFSDNPTRSLVNRKIPHHEQESLLYLSPADDVDLIYYVKFDAMKVFDDGGNWEDVVERAELIWEK